MGDRAYGLYLYHFALAGLIPGLIPNIRLAVAGPLIVVLSFAIAEASYRFAERPLMAEQDWLSSRRPDSQN